MKRRLLVALISALFFTPNFAQTQFSVGVKAGLNFANLYVANASGSYDGRTGYHAGAFALLKKENFAVQPEIVLSQQGTKVTVNQRDFESSFNYINVPVLVKYYFFKSKNGGGINVHAGPQIGFLQSAKADVIDSITFMFKKDQDVKRSYKKSDISACLGAGWDTPFGLTVDVRYNLGLRRIEEDENAHAIKNQVFQVGRIYKLFKLGC